MSTSNKLTQYSRAVRDKITRLFLEQISLQILWYAYVTDSLSQGINISNIYQYFTQCTEIIQQEDGDSRLEWRMLYT